MLQPSRNGNVAGSGAPRGLMDEPGSSGRGSLETLALAGIGAFVLGADRVDELADELAEPMHVLPQSAILLREEDVRADRAGRG